jgi:hypothetical protein
VDRDQVEILLDITSKYWVRRTQRLSEIVCSADDTVELLTVFDTMTKYPEMDVTVTWAV